MSMERVDQSDVFVPTDVGREQLHQGRTHLSAAALAVLVLLDGRKNLGEVVQETRGLAPDEVHQAAQTLANERYVEIKGLEDEIKIDFSLLGDAPPATVPFDQAHQEALDDAEKVAQTISLEGYYVNIARSAVKRKPPAAGSTYSVLVIEDSVEIQQLLKFLLTFEHFAPRFAGKRDEIVAELRKVPSPDVILLDVGLPDANGFDILARVRQHPKLKSIPIIMLTALATREDVLRGIAGGANGYITKPFQRDHVLAGIRSVLGI